jgi:hypothetical protein
MFQTTRKTLNLQKLGRGVYCVGAYHPTITGTVCHYQVFGTRGAYEVGVSLDAGMEPEHLGIATTLAQAEQIINNHYTSL